MTLNDLWARKSAGFLIPLFSLRTEKSLGIGDISDLYPLIDWAADHGQSIVQLLPINDIRPGDASPYAAVSAFATNPLYINIDAVSDVAASKEAGVLIREWEADGTFNSLRVSEKVDYVAVRAVKMALLKEGFQTFLKNEWEAHTERGDALALFIDSERHWLQDYAAFRILKEINQETEWRSWQDEYRFRDGNALNVLADVNHHRYLFHQWLQWIFQVQWREMRSYAHGKGVYLMGDVSFYPGVDSAEVWSRRDLFQINEDLSLASTSGAPPDYFNPDGQNWGTPLYQWEKMEAEDFDWWVRRVERVCDFFDLYRLDHFRGFESYWRIPAGKPATEGCWVKAPGEKLLQQILKHSLCDNLYIPLAEDLGDISFEVHQLRRTSGIAGYKTFIYGWGEGETSGRASGYRYPEEYDADFLATTGTHDTPTLSHWWEALREDEKEALLHYLDLPPDPSFTDVKEAVLKKLFHSKALFVLLPFQDIFGLDPEHRINVPGTFGEHNWSWRMPVTIETLLSSRDGDLFQASSFLREMTRMSGRSAASPGLRQGEVAVLPGAGSRQVRRKKEFFRIWAATKGKAQEVLVSSVLTGGRGVAMNLKGETAGGVSIYEAVISADRSGLYSLKVLVDGGETAVLDCLQVI